MPNKTFLTLFILCLMPLALSACKLPLAVTPLPPPVEETLPPLPPATADYPTPSAPAPTETAATLAEATITPIVLTATLTTPLTITLPAPSEAATASATPEAPASPLAGAESVDPCSLLTESEAAAILGEEVQDPIIDGYACSYTDSTSQSRLVSAFAVQGAQAKNALGSYLVQLGNFGLQLDQATQDELFALDRQGANRELLTRMIELSKGNSAFSSRTVDGLAELAYWAWKDTGHGVRQGFLIALRGDTLAGASLVSGDKVDENLGLDLTTLIVRQAFTRLPPQFILVTPGP